MRLGRLAVVGLTAGVVAGFVIALLLPRRRRTVLDLTAVEIETVTRPQPEAADDATLLHVEHVEPAAPTPARYEP